MSKVLAVIPARWHSSRFPGKPLAKILGEPMIVHVWRRAQAAETINSAVVATDDERIVATCQHNAIDVTMTSQDHLTGTDRLAEVAQKITADIYVNIQGDEPAINPCVIDAVVRRLQEARSSGIEVATAYRSGATPDQCENKSVVHLIPTLDACVMTFTRFPIPYNFRERYNPTVHVGIYAYTALALKRFSEYKPGPIERAESIEPLRFLERGERIACVEIESPSIGVDHPEDIEKAEAMLMECNYQ